MIIGYVAQKFPQLTLTFVYREVFALRAAGLHIETFSIWKPALDELSDEAKILVKDTFYVFPLNWPQFLGSHIGYLLTRPRRYLGALWFCLTRKHKTFKNRVRTLYHFCEAVHMAKEVERRNVKHLHVHFALNATTVALVISRLTDVTFSFTAHANDIFVNPILLPEKIKAARFIIAISEYNKRFLCKVVCTQETRSKTHLVRYGIDVQQFSPSSCPLHSGLPTILAVGRLVEKKGYPYLIKACKILVGQGYNFRCLIVGGGPQEALLRRLIAENDLASYVSLEGIVFQEHLKEYLNRADMFVLPCIVANDGDQDGIPNSLIEAMAMAIPALSTRISGIPELIEHEHTGWLVPEKDERALAEALSRLLDNKLLRQRLGKAGRQRIEQEYALDKNGVRLKAIFEQYLS